ncbi:MAG: thiamine diphosphokinase [Clostridia bacterium]|nr:thiamine diphosphokinase [Clostridia bacterium]
MGICFIVGAGDFTPRDFTPSSQDCVIAADGGLRPLLAMGITPDLLMGDLDSLGQFDLPASLPLVQFPVEKDDTDTGIALAHGWQLGYRQFALYGCSGGRADHLLANWQSMCRMSRMGAQIHMTAQDYDAYALTNGSLVLPGRSAGTTVSVFCMSQQASGVTLTGLKYPLSDASLSCDYPLGVSNCHTGGEACISVQEGTLLILQYLNPQS